KAQRRRAQEDVDALPPVEPADHAHERPSVSRAELSPDAPPVVARVESLEIDRVRDLAQEDPPGISRPKQRARRVADDQQTRREPQGQIALERPDEAALDDD